MTWKTAFGCTRLWPPVTSAQKLESSRSSTPPSLMHESKRSELQCNMTSPWRSWYAIRLAQGTTTLPKANPRLLEHTRWTRNRRRWIVTSRHQGPSNCDSPWTAWGNSTAISHRALRHWENQARCSWCCILASFEHRYRVARRKMLDMSGTPVGTTKGTHGEHTDSNETIPDGGRRYVRVRWQALSVTAGLLQPLHRSRGALLNPCIIHHHINKMNHGQTRYTRTGIFRKWAAVLMRGIWTICKHMGIRPLDLDVWDLFYLRHRPRYNRSS